MRMSMRDIAAREQERHALDTMQAPEDGGQALPDAENLRGDCSGNGVEVREVLARNDLYVTRANGIDVQKREHVCRLIDSVRRNLAACDSAEQARLI